MRFPIMKGNRMGNLRCVFSFLAFLACVAGESRTVSADSVCPESVLTTADLLGGAAPIPSEGLESYSLVAALEQLGRNVPVPNVLDAAVGGVGELSRIAAQGEDPTGDGSLLIESRSVFLEVGARAGTATSLGSSFTVGSMVRGHMLWQLGGALGAAASGSLPLCLTMGPLSVLMPRVGLDASWPPSAGEAAAGPLRLVPAALGGVFQPAGSAVVALRGGLTLGLTSPFSSTEDSLMSDSLAASAEVLVFHRSVLPRVPALISSRVGVQTLLDSAEESQAESVSALTGTGWTWSSLTRILMAPRLTHAVSLGGALELHLVWLPQSAQSVGGGGRLWLTLSPAQRWRIFLQTDGRVAQMNKADVSIQRFSTFGWAASVSYAF